MKHLTDWSIEHFFCVLLLCLCFGDAQRWVCKILIQPFLQFRKYPVSMELTLPKFALCVDSNFITLGPSPC